MFLIVISFPKASLENNVLWDRVLCLLKFCRNPTLEKKGYSVILTAQQLASSSAHCRSICRSPQMRSGSSNAFIVALLAIFNNCFISKIAFACINDINFMFIWLVPISERYYFVLIIGNMPLSKKYSLLRDKYFCEDSIIQYLHSKFFWICAVNEKILKYVSNIRARYSISAVAS